MSHIPVFPLKFQLWNVPTAFFLALIALGFQWQGWGSFPRISSHPKGFETYDLQGKTQSISNSRGIFPSFGPDGNRNFIPT